MSKLSHSTDWSVAYSSFDEHFVILPDGVLMFYHMIIRNKLMLQDATDLSHRLNMELMKSDV